MMAINGKATRLAAPALAAVLAAVLPHAACAQPSAYIEQIGDNNRTAIEQRGVDNSAAATVHGDRNGTGTIGAQSRNLIAYPRQSFLGATLPILSPRSGPSAGSLDTPALESGVISQDGDDHLARVNVFGDDNRFHVSQQGKGNVAVQAIRGTLNQAAAVQGDSSASRSNLAVQAQSGTGNVAVALQKDDGLNPARNNVAVQLQGGVGAAVAGTALNLGLLTPASAAANLGATNSAEAALTAMASGNNNVSLLEQKGANNVALLVQAGDNNSIALRQPGNSYASVTQLGNNHAIGIDQRAGTNGTSPIVITQH